MGPPRSRVYSAQAGMLAISLHDTYGHRPVPSAVDTRERDDFDAVGVKAGSTVPWRGDPNRIDHDCGGGFDLAYALGNLVPGVVGCCVVARADLGNVHELPTPGSSDDEEGFELPVRIELQRRPHMFARGCRRLNELGEPRVGETGCGRGVCSCVRHGCLSMVGLS